METNDAADISLCPSFSAYFSDRQSAATRAVNDASHTSPQWQSELGDDEFGFAARRSENRKCSDEDAFEFEFRFYKSSPEGEVGATFPIFGGGAEKVEKRVAVEEEIRASLGKLFRSSSSFFDEADELYGVDPEKAPEMSLEKLLSFSSLTSDEADEYLVGVEPGILNLKQEKVPEQSLRNLLHSSSSSSFDELDSVQPDKATEPSLWNLLHSSSSSSFDGVQSEKAPEMSLGKLLQTSSSSSSDEADESYFVRPATYCVSKLMKPPELSLRKLFHSSSSSSDEFERVEPVMHCVWKPKKTTQADQSPERCKKSKSTGSLPKRWKLSDMIHKRSNSDGKQSSFMTILTPSSSTTSSSNSMEEVNAASSPVKPNKPVRRMSASELRTKSASASAHELFYVKNRAVKEEDKRRSYLPYRNGLMGFGLTATFVRSKMFVDLFPYSPYC